MLLCMLDVTGLDFTRTRAELSALDELYHRFDGDALRVLRELDQAEARAVAAIVADTQGQATESDALGWLQNEHERLRAIVG